jgi:hypothetical protein
MPVKLMPIAAGQVEVPLASPCINYVHNAQRYARDLHPQDD